MNEIERRRVITDMLDKLRADMLAGVERMPDDWKVEWYLAPS